MTANKWQMQRAGILNYWYYDEAEFVFAGGRLLLRGSNGSGKSVTMQSLITVLLDGVKTADRLDSFGSRSRRIEDYLLGEKEISNFDERTGYLFLEYKRENSEQYITTGIGLHARRGAGRVDFWGFVITDGRRINKDIYLYKLNKNPQTGEKQRVPLSKRELENKIGTGGRLAVSQNEYMQLVNRYIFGFKDIEKYQELMRLLIQLRSPKLSRDFKPSVIYDILNASLPSLSEDELRPLSETMESMEKTKLSIEQFKNEKHSFDKICKIYDLYNTAVLAEKLSLEKRYNHHLAALDRQIKDNESGQAAEKEQLQISFEQKNDLEIEQDNLTQENEELKNNEIYQSVQKKEETDAQLNDLTKKYKSQEKFLTDKRRRELDFTEEIAKQQQKIAAIEEKARDILDDMADFAAAADIPCHTAMTVDFTLAAQKGEIHFAAWQKSLQDYNEHLKQLKKMAQQYQKMEEKNNRLEASLSSENKLLDEDRTLAKKLLRSLDNERDKLVKEFYEWEKQYQNIFPLEQSAENKIAGVLQNLYDGAVWSDAAQTFDMAYAEKTQQLNAQIGKAQAQLKSAEEEEAQLRQELKILQEAAEAVPPLDDENEKARARLHKENIKFVPFYEAVEFRDTVETDQRNNIEAALTNAGVLNALILTDDSAAENLPEFMRGNILYTAQVPLLTATLYDYLKPASDCAVSEERISAVLSSIAVNEKFYELPSAKNCICLNVAKGSYSYANLAGCACTCKAASFIGAQARRAFRKLQIEEKQGEAEKIAETIENIYGSLNKLKEANNRLIQAREAFPKEKEILELFRSCEQQQAEIKRQQQRVNEIDEEKKNVIIKMRTLQQEAAVLRSSGKLPFDEEKYEEALDTLSEYKISLSSLKLCQNDYDNAFANQQRAQKDLEYIRDEIDRLRGDLLDLELKSKKLRERLKTLEEYLRQTDAAGIKHRIAEVTARLKAIPQKIINCAAARAKSQTKLEQLVSELSVFGKKHDFYEKIHQQTIQILNAEIKRGLIFQEKPDEKKLCELQIQWEKSGAPSPADLSARLNKNFFSEQSVLTEYRPQMHTAADVIDEESTAAMNDEEHREWTALENSSKRQIITIQADGQLLSPYQQKTKIERHLLEQENLLSEQDKKLYEEIIMNSIGRVISQRIYAAEHWIKQMNELMKKSDTSSGLKFHLEWKALKGEDDDELDTAELVKLLHMDPVLLKKEDMKKVVRHFAVRIERAKEEAALQEKDSESFQNAVRNLLDYRQWFSFKLFYDQGEQIKHRELTDKIFFRFSGGEKAMAMYIPLFSAAYSRYLEAGSDAPFVITLDEAFAGVDEKNIRDMFNLVEKLHFNYIMNSQAIWGDYDVVPSLNIYELLRPANVPYVSTVKYHWNGSAKTVLFNDENDEESNNDA